MATIVEGNKIKLIIYYSKFNTINLVINNNFSPSDSHFRMTNLVYEFKCLLRESFSNKIDTNICLTTMILLRHLILHLSDTSSTPEYLKTYSSLSFKLQKHLTENTFIFHEEKKLQMIRGYKMINKPSLNKIRC